ncbi:MAG: DNA-formamidopyrimidine glycosylase family protein [Actinomycetota bacterium]
MPEGHTIHRHARLQNADMAGRRLGVTSPQGWAADAAAEVDGRVLERVEAYGKHLFYRFEGAPAAMQVHLGLFGRFWRWDEPAPPPRDTTRLRFIGGERTLDLTGAIISGLIEPETEAALFERLGPDPLRADADPERAWQRLQRKRIGLGAALLDQTVIAGLGNAFRAEILFACGHNPAKAAGDLTREQFDELWAITVDFLKRGERSGQMVTVPREEAGKPPSRLRGRDRVQVYRREHCRRCGSPTHTAKVAGRTLYSCPVCQA